MRDERRVEEGIMGLLFPEHPGKYGSQKEFFMILKEELMEGIKETKEKQERIAGLAILHIWNSSFHPEMLESQLDIWDLLLQMLPFYQSAALSVRFFVRVKCEIFKDYSDPFLNFLRISWVPYFKRNYEELMEYPFVSYSIPKYILQLATDIQFLLTESNKHKSMKKEQRESLENGLSYITERFMPILAVKEVLRGEHLEHVCEYHVNKKRDNAARDYLLYKHSSITVFTKLIRRMNAKISSAKEKKAICLIHKLIEGVFKVFPNFLQHLRGLTKKLREEADKKKELFILANQLILQVLRELREYKWEAKEFGGLLQENYRACMGNDPQYQIASQIIFTIDLFESVPALKYWLFPSKSGNNSEVSKERSEGKEEYKREKDEGDEINKLLEDMNKHKGDIIDRGPHRTYSVSKSSLSKSGSSVEILEVPVAEHIIPIPNTNNPFEDAYKIDTDNISNTKSSGGDNTNRGGKTKSKSKSQSKHSSKISNDSHYSKPDVEIPVFPEVFYEEQYLEPIANMNYYNTNEEIKEDTGGHTYLSRGNNQNHYALFEENMETISFPHQGLDSHLYENIGDIVPEHSLNDSNPYIQQPIDQQLSEFVEDLAQDIIQIEQKSTKLAYDRFFDIIKRILKREIGECEIEIYPHENHINQIYFTADSLDLTLCAPQLNTQTISALLSKVYSILTTEQMSEYLKNIVSISPTPNEQTQSKLRQPIHHISFKLATEIEGPEIRGRIFISNKVPINYYRGLLISKYLEFYPILHKISIFILKWGSQKKLIDGGKDYFSTPTLLILIIFFLQKEGQIGSLQEVANRLNVRNIREAVCCWQEGFFVYEIDANKGTQQVDVAFLQLTLQHLNQFNSTQNRNNMYNITNQISTGRLIYNFFEYFSKDYEHFRGVCQDSRICINIVEGKFTELREEGRLGMDRLPFIILDPLIDHEYNLLSHMNKLGDQYKALREELISAKEALKEKSTFHKILIEYKEGQ